MYISQLFIHSLADGHVGCFQCGYCEQSFHEHSCRSFKADIHIHFSWVTTLKQNGGIISYGSGLTCGDRKRGVAGTRKLFGVMDVFIILIPGMVSWMSKCGKMCHTVHFKYVQFIVLSTTHQ